MASSSSSNSDYQQHSDKLEAGQQMQDDDLYKKNEHHLQLKICDHDDDDRHIGIDDDEEYYSSTKHMAFVIIGIFVTMNVAMGTIWAVVKPEVPVYAIEYGKISDATIPSDRSFLVGNFSFVMRCYNPNTKATIYYDSMEIFSSNGSDDKSLVWSGKNFSQPPSNITRIGFSLFAEVYNIRYHDMLEYLQHGNVSSNISAEAQIRYVMAGWRKSSPLHIGIYCQPANVMLANNFQATDCYAHF